MLLTIAALAVLLAADPAPAAPASPPRAAVAPDLSPEAAALAAVRPNVALVKTRPKYKSDAYPQLPDALRALGHHGEVTISGVLGTDGRLTSTSVARPSGSAELDALALAAANAALFEPALDAEGKPLAIPLSVPYEFYAYKSDAPGGGLVRYGCRQFVLDQDWWRSTHPGARRGDHELYVMMLGLNTIIGGGLGAGGVEGFKARMADFERRWDASIEKCRKAPDKRFIDMIGPEGKAAEAMSKASR